VPAFNTATLESEKATLKNAVVAAEQKMNEMVYDIYALTDDERKAVENASINPN